jgi:hypothetical protein
MATDRIRAGEAVGPVEDLAQEMVGSAVCRLESWWWKSKSSGFASRWPSFVSTPGPRNVVWDGLPRDVLLGWEVQVLSKHREVAV